MIIWKGVINSLRRFKDDVREVQAGFECGIGLSDYQDLQGGRHHRDLRGARDPEGLRTRTGERCLRRRRSFPAHGGARYARSLRINQVLREVLAEELERLADADERLRLLTITSVETAPDLRNATVYLSTLEDEAAEALEERRTQLQRTVGRQMRIKRTPRLSLPWPTPPSVRAPRSKRRCAGCERPPEEADEE